MRELIEKRLNDLEYDMDVLNDELEAQFKLISKDKNQNYTMYRERFNGQLRVFNCMQSEKEFLEKLLDEII